MLSESDINYIIEKVNFIEGLNNLFLTNEINNKYGEYINNTIHHNYYDHIENIKYNIENMKNDLNNFNEKGYNKNCIIEIVESSLQYIYLIYNMLNNDKINNKYGKNIMNIIINETENDYIHSLNYIEFIDCVLYYIKVILQIFQKNGVELNSNINTNIYIL